jgi:hypothetical protein
VPLISRAPTASADSAPTVVATVAGTFDIGGSVDIKAVALGDASSTARGSGGGIVSVWARSAPCEVAARRVDAKLSAAPPTIDCGR